MNKRNGYLILGIVYAVFTAIAFAVPFTKTPVFWVSYLFGLVAVCFQIPLWTKALKGESLKSKFLGFPVLYIGVTYLTVQLIISLIMMAVSGIPIWVAIIVDVVILAITCTLVLSGDVAKTAIEKTEEKVQTKTSFIKGLKADVDILLSKEEDPEVKKELESLADDIRYSDPMSSDTLEDIEKKIVEIVTAISIAGQNKMDLIAEAKELIQQRNIKCKALK
ncbi:MAG: hypothetical protein IKE30_05285 [Clostridia bacterium]|nr:hypothetical protein [Clostridia bacterium]